MSTETPRELSGKRPRTLAQKILQRHTADEVADGRIVQCRVSMVLANDIDRKSVV